MYKASFKKYDLEFIRPAGTSRGVLTTKPSWFIFVIDTKSGITGIGECSIIPGLSYDNISEIENTLSKTCQNINDIDSLLETELKDFPAIRFGLETALLDIQNGGKRILFPNGFTYGVTGIDINGLIWMGDVDFMLSQIKDKIESGFTCLKMKIGAIDFNQEINIIKEIRKNFSSKEIELRVDANGAFSPKDAINKLNILSQFDIHSIEQPIEAGQINEMHKLCMNTPLPIALDEELIGISDFSKMENIISTINPQYIILKPSLIGGFALAEKWIQLAEKYSVGWWITSALESNIGLNAIAQWTQTLGNTMPHGLGTGLLFENNIGSPLNIKKGKLYYNQFNKWDLTNII